MQFLQPNNTLGWILPGETDSTTAMAAGDSISDAEEENEEESKRSPTPRTLRRNSFVDGIRVRPPPSNTWSLVSIKDNREGEDDPSSLIFPPTYHENLHLSPPSPPAAPPHPVLDFRHHERSLTLPFLSSSSSSLSETVDEDESNDDSSTSTLSSPSTGPDSPPCVPRERKMVGVSRWVNLGIGIGVLFSKVKGVLLYGSSRIPVKKSAFTTLAMAVGFLYLWWRRRRGRIALESGDRVARIIKEKDERIDQLLNQIARMNDLLMALQRLPAPSKDLR